MCDVTAHTNDDHLTVDEKIKKDALSVFTSLGSGKAHLNAITKTSQLRYVCAIFLSSYLTSLVVIIIGLIIKF